jgi:hypothetical protein
VIFSGLMPDPTLDIELPEPAADRPPIFAELGPHPYQESEFAHGRGHCDKCGGGPDAKIHNYVDPQERIADALEKIAAILERDL